MPLLFSFRYLNLITNYLFSRKFLISFSQFLKITYQSNYFLNEKYLDPKKLFKDPMKAPNTQAILQFSINLQRITITKDISIPPKKQIKQNKEKDFNKGLLELFLKTQDFAKTKEIIIPTQ